MTAAHRGFVLRHTRLQPVPGLEDVRLHLADAVLPLWRAVQEETGDPDAPLPYWAFAWAGGLALGQHLGLHPEAVAGKDVLDLASGSGLVAIAALRAGARTASAADIDPFAAAAIAANAQANGHRVRLARGDVLDRDPPAVDVILAGDCWYEAVLAERVTAWLRRADARGIAVLAGDPGRRYLPVRDLVEVAAYEVRTTTDLEDMDLKAAGVYRLRQAPPAGGIERAASPSRGEVP